MFDGGVVVGWFLGLEGVVGGGFLGLEGRVEGMLGQGGWGRVQVSWL